MKENYEKVISMVEECEINDKSDKIIQMLGEEMESKRRGRAMLKAAKYIVKNPETDISPLGKLQRLSGLIPEQELDRRVGLIVDILFGEHFEAPFLAASA